MALLIFFQEFIKHLEYIDGVIDSLLDTIEDTHATMAGCVGNPFLNKSVSRNYEA